MSEDKKKEHIKEFFSKILDSKEQKEIVNSIIKGNNIEDMINSFIKFEGEKKK